MKFIFTLFFFSLSSPILAFDFKELADKVAKDKKTQEQIKDAAKKGMDYFQGDKKEEEEDKKGEGTDKKEATPAQPK